MTTIFEIRDHIHLAVLLYFNAILLAFTGSVSLIYELRCCEERHLQDRAGLERVKVYIFLSPRTFVYLAPALCGIIIQDGGSNIKYVCSAGYFNECFFCD